MDGTIFHFGVNFEETLEDEASSSQEFGGKRIIK